VKYKYYKGSFVIGKKADGTPERVYVRGKTKSERDEKLSEAKRLYARGLQAGDITVREWAQRWLSVYKANVSENMKLQHSARLRYDVLPAIGSLRMRDIRPSTLQQLLNEQKGGKRGTVTKLRMTLRDLFGAAEVEGIIERNPAQRIGLPEMSEKARRPLTETERETVWAVAW
jgi:hypothetical protein